MAIGRRVAGSGRCRHEGLRETSFGQLVDDACVCIQMVQLPSLHDRTIMFPDGINAPLERVLISPPVPG